MPDLRLVVSASFKSNDTRTFVVLYHVYLDSIKCRSGEFVFQQLSAETTLHDDFVCDIAAQRLVREADAVLDTYFVLDLTVRTQDSDRLYLDTVLDNAGAVTGHGRRRALNTSPCTNLARPTNDRVKDTCIMPDLSISKHNGLLDTDARSNDGTGSDRYIGTQLSSRIYFRIGVNEDWWQNCGGRFFEFFRLRLEGL